MFFRNFKIVYKVKKQFIHLLCIRNLINRKKINATCLIKNNFKIIHQIKNKNYTS